MEGELGTCAICFAALNAFSVVRLDCQHNFHQRCIFKAVSIRNACPLCNRPLYDVNQIISESHNKWNWFWLIVKIFAAIGAIIFMSLVFAGKIW